MSHLVIKTMLQIYKNKSKKIYVPKLQFNFHEMIPIHKTFACYTHATIPHISLIY